MQKWVSRAANGDSTLTGFSPAFENYIAPARARPKIWRLLLGLIIVAVVYLALNGAGFLFLVFTTGFETAQFTLASIAIGSTPATALAVLASFAPLAIGVMVAARVMQKRGPASLFGPLRPMARDFLRSAFVSLGIFGTLAAVGLAFVETDPYLPPRLWLALLPFALLAIATQTLAEELLFRGYLQQQLAARFVSRFFWMVLPALVFGALHFNPDSIGVDRYLPVVFAFVFGLVAADLTARTGTIGAAWGLHFVINVLGISVVNASGILNGLALHTIPFEASERSLAPILLITDAIPLLLVWLVLRRVLRR